MLRKVSAAVSLYMFVLACNNNQEENGQQRSDDSLRITTGMHAAFKKGKIPYQLTDTALAGISPQKEPPYDFSKFIPDSMRHQYFGKNAALRYTPIAYIAKDAKENFYIVHASAARKKAAYLLVCDAEGRFVASMPFLLPDDNPNTLQSAVIDKAFTITKTIIMREGGDIVGEGKEVLAYEPSTKSFGVIMMDALNDRPLVLTNPIDTFPKTNKLAGDYVINKKNMVSVRDGRYANQLLVYIHTENETGDCIGQMKGEFLITSSTSATYRQGGDPCVLNLHFKANTVSINEESGCGNYRGLDCQLAGTFTRKKPQPVKQTLAKPKRK